MTTTTTKYEIEATSARQIRDWILTRGGAAVWRSQDLADPGREVLTPVHNAEGQPVTSPHWSLSKAPVRVLTMLDEVEVVQRREVTRFRVALKQGQGFRVDVTAGGHRRIERALAKAGDGAQYHFDYETQEAVITLPSGRVPLTEFSSQ